MPDSARPLRADAARNRGAILDAAAEVFARGGSDISLEEVAHLAGVGVGTVYRRFPTRDTLLSALMEGRMVEYAEHAEAVAELASSQPWVAFRTHVEFLACQQVEDLAFSDLLRDPDGQSDELRALRRRALRASMVLVNRAKAAGVVRSDLEHSDLLLLTDANHGVVTAHRDLERPSAAGPSSQRLVEFLLEAFRADPPNLE